MQPAPPADLSLRDALLLANQRNENLSREGEAYLRTIIGLRRAVANFLPTVNLAPSYVVREDTGGGGGGDDDDDDDDDDDGGATDGGAAAGRGSAQNDFLDVPVDLNINLFNGFREIYRYWRDTYLIE